jgi:hypothetical protein
VFEPENSLEALMQAAAKDPGVVPTFYRALLDTELYILTPEVPVKPGRRRSLKFREKINVASVEFQGMIWASRLHVEEAHIRLCEGAGSLPRCGGPQSDAAQREFLAQSAICMPEAIALRRTTERADDLLGRGDRTSSHCRA